VYLISVEGGDGSGKGEAVRLLNEILAKYPFAEICSTHEPRRHAEAGRKALAAVQRGDMTPAEEAALFAEDRLDHTHSWILPRLKQSAVVISDRNIHSSLVYQGVVGDLGLDEVAQLNEGAAVPDLVVWIDCDPDRAIRRIQSGTLRMTSAKQEYFETSEIQKKIRAGFASLLSGEIEAPPPFDACTIAGPVLNEGGLDELAKALRKTVRDFMRSRPEPHNVDAETVDRHVIATLVEGLSAQQRLPGMVERSVAGHLDGTCRSSMA
jgi:dTMP kinase